jgi:predicted ATPase
VVLFCLGYPDNASAKSSAAVAEARRLAHPPSIASSLALGARLLSLNEDSATLGQWVDQLVAVTTEQGLPHWGAQGAIFRGWVEVKNGHIAEGIAMLRSGSAAYRDTGAEVWMPYHVALLARAYEIAGQIEEGARLLDDAVQAVERSGERWFAAEINRLRGQLLLRQGHGEAAEEPYRKALSIAGEQEAKLWELRAGWEPRPAMARSGEARRGARSSCTGLRLVHRRFRHTGLKGCKNAARRVGISP